MERYRGCAFYVLMKWLQERVLNYKGKYSKSPAYETSSCELSKM